jgi:hypothetical protein
MKNNIETIFTHETDDGAIGELGIDKNAKLYCRTKSYITGLGKHFNYYCFPFYSCYSNICSFTVLLQYP